MTNKTESSTPSSFEEWREHHISTKYGPDIFPESSNILNRLKELGRLAPTQDLLNMDEGVFFDRSNLHLLPTFKKHLLGSIASLINNNEAPIYIAKSIVKDCIDVPKDVFANDLSEYFGKVGENADDLRDVTETKTKELLQSFFVPNTFTHEVEHLDMIEELIGKKPYFIYNIQFIYTRDKDIIIATSGGVTHHSDTTSAIDSMKISMAPKFPSHGDFNNVRKELKKIRENGDQEEIHRAKEILRSKLRIYGYATPPDNGGINLRLQVRGSVKPIRIAELVGIPSIDGNISADNTCIDIRRFEDIAGNSYASKQFSDKFGVDQRRVANLAYVTG